MSEDMRTVDSVFGRAASLGASKPHLIFPNGPESTYSNTYERASRLAGALRQSGVERGDRVVSLMGNCRALYEFFIATSLLGVIAVPINVQNTSHEIGRLVRDCSAVGCVGEGERIAALSGEVFHDARVRMTVSSSLPGWLDYEAAIGDATPVMSSASAGCDVALIIYSSGTTGEPKGIMLRHECLIENALRVIERLGYNGADVFLTLLPSFHLFGYSFDFLYSGIVGAPMVVMPEFNPAKALELIERHEVTVLTGVPTMFARMFDPQMLVGRRIGSIRLLDVGGGPVSPTIKKQLKGLGIDAVESYGLTEISTVAAVQLPSVDAPEGSCGPLLRDITMKVVDTVGGEVAAGESGELLFRAPTFMAGYWNQPELTAHTLLDGWLHTGDVGKIDADGNVYILDRVKDMVVVNGFNVFPKEVENALASHPAVLTAAVVGVPDELRGEDIHAFVVLRPGAQARGEELIEHCRERLARYKMPRNISLVDQLPLTATGKIRRFQLREMALTEIEAGRSIRVSSTKSASAPSPTV